MSLTATYDAALSRVRLAATALDVTATSAVMDRTTDGVNWSVVRGGQGAAISGGVWSLDDYEFPAGVAVTYRVRSYLGATLKATFTTAITQDLTAVWLKVVPRPFLNRAVVVSDVSPVSRPDRSGLFPVVGRTAAVAVNDVRGGREYQLELVTEDQTSYQQLDYIIASGDAVFVHVPLAEQHLVPGGYFTIGTAAAARSLGRSPRRIWSLPLTEVAAPGADVVGAAVTWNSVLAAFATWNDLLAAVPTWNDLLELIGSGSEVIVP